MHRLRNVSVMHIALMVIGTLFLLVDAFHGNIWFDESYSVGIASMGFAEIWHVGSFDVHPVLYYWGLHLVYLLFGANILAYRIFTVLGIVCLAALGLFQIKRDFGAHVGFVFSFLVFFTPYVAFMAVQIRMYAWVAFTVMVCALYAYRIGLRSLGFTSVGVDQSDSLDSSSRKIPISWWVIVGVSGLASAYLQYFGAMSAFVIHLILLVTLIYASVRKAGQKRNILHFCLVAVLEVLSYVPWLLKTLVQVGVVSTGTYWSKFEFPDSIRELFTYPIATLQVLFTAWWGDHGIVMQILMLVGLVALGITSAAVVVLSIRIYRRDHRIRGTLLVPALVSLATYLGLLLVGSAASLVIGSWIMYYRYAFVAIGPLLFSCGCLIVYVITDGSPRDELVRGHLDSKPSQLGRHFGFGCLAAVFVVGVLAQGLSVYDNYSPNNQKPFEYFSQLYEDATVYHDIDVLEDEEPQEKSEEAAALSMMGEDNDQQTTEHDGQFNETDVESRYVSEVPLVVSTDIGVQSLMALKFPDIEQTYMDWQRGNWDEAYQVYGDRFTIAYSWDELLKDYEGTFIVIGQTNYDQMPKSIKELIKTNKAEVIESETFYRPYERSFFTVALMQKIG